MVRRALALMPLLTGLLPAQTGAVLPESHRAVEGTGSTNVPFGRSTPVRVQMMYDGALFPRAGSIASIALRLDGGATAASKQVDCEIRMSTMPRSLVAMSSVFAQNRGADEVVVLPRQILSLPGDQAGTTPNAFQTPIALAVPFAYAPANGPLVVEIVVHGQPPGSYALDTTWLCTSPQAAIGPAGCQGASGLPVRVESATTNVIWGRPWVTRVLDARPGNMTVMVLGTTETGTWNGASLPFDLQVLGAPQCFVSIDVAGSFYQVAQGDGTATFTFAIPNVPAAVGAWLRFQGGAIDTGANALGVITSQARKVQVCGWEQVGRVWASGTAAATGQWEIGVAPVLSIAIQ